MIKQLKDIVCDELCRRICEIVQLKADLAAKELECASWKLVVDADDEYLGLMQQSALRRGYPTDEFRQKQNDAWVKRQAAKKAAGGEGKHGN